MTSRARPMGRVRGRLRLAVAGAVMVTALSAATAAAAPTPMGVQADVSPRSLRPGFLLERGRYTTLEVPGATVETAPIGINNRGQIVGTARTGIGGDRGFLRDARGRITTIRVPGAKATTAQKLNDRGVVDKVLTLNDRGQVGGAYSDPGTAGQVPIPANTLYGFVWNQGRLTRLDVPRSVATLPLGIDNAGHITGSYADANGRKHGFLLQRGAMPGSTRQAGQTPTRGASTTAARSSCPNRATAWQRWRPDGPDSCRCGAWRHS
jgi:hypothetical protein